MRLRTARHAAGHATRPPTPTLPASAPPDPWVALVAPRRPGPDPAPQAARPAVHPETALLARADAVLRAAGGSTDGRGRPVRVQALCVDHGKGVDLVLSAPAVVLPTGWQAHPEQPRHVRVPSRTGLTGASAAVPALVVVAFATPDGRPVHLDLAAVGVVGAPADALASVAAALLRSPLCAGLDVVLSGVDPGGLPPAWPGGPGRLHLAPDTATATALALALAGGDEPLVAVLRAGHHDSAPPDLEPLRRSGVGVVTDAGAALVHWRLEPTQGGTARWTLAPLGWPLGALLPV